jgi:hypothetical protein
MLQKQVVHMLNTVFWWFNKSYTIPLCVSIQSAPGAKVSILGDYSIGHFKQESIYVHVSYSERFPR